MNELGAQIKDLDIGLIDFPTMYRGREVLLCWKLGEERIAFWHGTDEGFKGRKAINDEFREQHRGNALQIDTPSGVADRLVYWMLLAHELIDYIAGQMVKKLTPLWMETSNPASASRIHRRRGR